MSIPPSAVGRNSPETAPSTPPREPALTISSQMRGAMANRGKEVYEIGFGKPPRSRQFKPGESGNPAGRPRGAKNFATAIEQELNSRVIVNENGRRKRISKREVIAKHLVNKAAGGGLQAIPLLLNQAPARQSGLSAARPDPAFDNPY